MGKEGDVWDDSALINAFDQAISKYKKMHGKGYKENPNNNFADVKSSNSSFDATPTQEHYSTPETHDGGKDSKSHAMLNVRETESLDTAKVYEVTDSEVTAEPALESSGMPVQDPSLDEYNKLYNQYYEVEEQRQNILQKLQNFSNWNYTYPIEAPASSVQWGATPATQEYHSSTSQVPCGTMVVSCCPCSCQYSTAACSSFPCPLAGVPAGNLCTDPSATNHTGRQSADKDVDIVKTAMGAAEKAISTLKNKIDSEQESNINNGEEQSAISGTDLSTVLNAWYSAGFYTGKYLTEQSHAKKQHD